MAPEVVEVSSSHMLGEGRETRKVHLQIDIPPWPSNRARGFHHRKLFVSVAAVVVLVIVDVHGLFTLCQNAREKERRTGSSFQNPTRVLEVSTTSKH